MTTFEFIEIAATYIWLHNVPEWIAQLKEMVPALLLFTGITIGIFTEVIEPEEEEEAEGAEKEQS